MEKYGILGGTFDPVHNAHIELAEYAYRELGLTKVVFIPAYIPPHKRGKKITDEHHRLNMVKLAVEGLPYFEVSDIELRLKGASYTSRTLEVLDNGMAKLVFIVGADSFMNLDTWHDPQSIFDRAEIACACRNGVDREMLRRKAGEYEEKYGGTSLLLNMPDTDISSTQIRELIRTGKNPSEYIPTAVWDYIKLNGLYTD